MRQRARTQLRAILNAGLDPETAPPDELRRVRNLTVATAGFTVLAVPVLIANFVALGPGFGLVLLAAMAAAVANVVALRHGHSIDRAGHFATGLLLTYLAWSLWHGGGVEEPSFASIYLVPLTAALLINGRAAAGWTAVCIAITGVFFVGAKEGLLPESILAGKTGDLYLILTHVVALLGVSLLAAAFSQNHEHLRGWLRASNEELERDSDYIRILHRTAVIANDAASGNEAMLASAELICDVLGWDVGSVWIATGKPPRTLEAIGGSVRDAERDGSLRREFCAGPIAEGQSFVGRAYRNRAPVFCDRVGSDPRFAHADAAERAGLQGALAFPIMLGHEVTGIFEFHRREGGGPDRQLLRLLTHVGTQVSRVMERERAEARIETLAYYDALTGLPNRQLFQDRLEEVLRTASERDRPAALLFVDLDGFKRVNDTLGHAVGDALLREVTRRFAQSLRLVDFLARAESAGHTVSRFGGDEFTVVLEKVPNRAGAAVVAERLLAALQSPIEIDGHEVFAGASIGIAMYPEDGPDVDTLLRRADAAMYAAKGRGRGQYRFATEGEAESGSRRMQLEGPLRRALQNDQFELHYQPLLDMRSEETLGAEALLRWHEPTLGNVSPGEFIPLAEQCGLINGIGDWIIRAACAQIAAWREEGFEPVRVAVNLSGQQIRGPSVVDCVAQALEENGLGPELLELEITESTIMRDDEVTADTLRALADLGVGLALDDFGTGYSSLSHLRRHPIDSLKLDRSFVSGVPESGDDVAIATAVIAMAHGLKKRVTAEGIETREQLEFLRGMGCDVAQGFLFSPAVPGNDFRRFLQRAKDDESEPRSRR